MNFALFLFVGIIVTGIVYAIEHLWLKKKRSSEQKAPWIIRELSSFFPILIAVFVLRSFVIEPFRIPSSSLEPTLRIGDFVAVNKFIYGVRLPIIEKKIIDIRQPKRGDIVVFRWPPKPKFDFIKRVIGLPGDEIRYVNKQFYINGQKINLTPTAMSFEKSPAFKEFIEDLPGQTHHIFQRSDMAPFDFKITVPKDHYLVIGDNRDDSADSRFWGFVPDNYLRGQAFGVWMSWDQEHWRVRFNRIGKAIH